MMEGVEVAVRQLGHVSLATTSIYLNHIAPKQVIEAMRKREWLMTASHFGMLNGMASIQIAVRLPVDLLETVDGLIKRGMAENRAELVREALERFVDEAERIRIDQAIIEGYRRLPATRDEEAAALAAIRQSIAEETW